MGTIPFPNVADEAGQIAAAPRTALEEYTRVAGLKAQQALWQQQQQQNAQKFPVEQQQAQATLQQTQQQNQIQQLQMQDQQTLRKIQPKHVQKDDNGVPTGYDFDGFFKDAIQSGVSPQTLQAMQEKHQEISKNALALDDSTRKAEQAKNQQLFENAESLRAVKDPAQREAAYQQMLMKAGRSGTDVSKWPAQAPNDDALTALEAPLGMHAQVLADAKTQSEIAKNLREGTASQLEAKYLGIQERLGLKQPVTAEEKAWARGYEKNKTMVPAFTINANATGAGMIPGGGGPAAPGGGAAAAPAKTIATVPNQIRGTVQQIIDYRAQLPPAGRSNPTNTAIRYWVNELDPNHDDTTYPARNKLMTSMTSGPQSKEINAINTALGHVGVLNDAIDALQNGNVPLLNRVANSLGIAIGETPATTFKTIVHRVGPELAAAYIQGGGSAGERGTDEKDFDANLGDKQLRSNAAITAKLLRSKIGSLENQYKNTMQRDDFNRRFLTPEAQYALDKLSPPKGGGGGKVASQQHVADYAKAKGISAQQAAQEFQAAGYTVQ